MLIKDRSTFDAIFREHYGGLVNYVYRIVTDVPRAEDIVQDVFYHLWERRATLSIDDNVSAYLIQACKYKAIEYIRSQKRDQEVIKAQVASLDEVTPLVAAEKLLLKEKINYSIRQLPTKCGEVFALSKLNGLTYTEIADRMGISVKTVENHMNRAFQLMREMLAPIKHLK